MKNNNSKFQLIILAIVFLLAGYMLNFIGENFTDFLN